MSQLNAAFFASVRASLFGGALTQGQVNGLNAVADAFAEHGDGDIRKLAYCLATKYHEVGEAMAPKVESLTYTSASRIRAVWPSRFKTLADAAPYVRQPQKLANFVYGDRADLGNDRPNDGWTYRGRGDAQLTGKGRYARFSALVGYGLVGNPELLLDVKIAAAVLVIGLVRGEFTGRRLADGVPDFVAARACVNGDGRANGKKIAGYAKKFLAALKGGLSDVAKPDAPPEPKPQPVPIPVEPLPPAKGGGLGKITLFIILALAAAGAIFFVRF